MENVTAGDDADVLATYNIAGHDSNIPSGYTLIRNLGNTGSNPPCPYCGQTIEYDTQVGAYIEELRMNDMWGWKFYCPNLNCGKKFAKSGWNYWYEINE